MRRAALAILVVCLSAETTSAHIGPPVDIATRAKGAEQVVVAKVVDLQATFDVSPYGDQLIVSHALLEVEETMKGPDTAAIQLMVEGGTVGNLTLRVSDMPTVETGERAVFFLDRTPSGTRHLHLRGFGMLKLDAANRVQGSSLTLDDVRRMVQAAK